MADPTNRFRPTKPTNKPLNTPPIQTQVGNRIFRDWRTTTGALLGLAIFLAGYFNIPILSIGDFTELIGILIATISGLLGRDK